MDGSVWLEAEEGEVKLGGDPRRLKRGREEKSKGRAERLEGCR